MSGRTTPNRRTVLRATGGLLGGVGVVGTASAACFKVEVTAPYAEVYDDCAGNFLDYVDDGAAGTTCDKCYDANGDVWWDCWFENADPDGWVHEDEVTVW